MKENPYGHMDERARRIAYLVLGFIGEKLTEKEHDELDNWINADDKNMKLFEELTDEKNLEANVAWMKQVQSQKSYDADKQAGKFKLPAKKFKISPVWVAAASLVFIVTVLFLYRYATHSGNSRNEIAANDTLQLHPGGDRATLTLEDGSIIDLADAKTGLIKSFSHVVVSKPGNGLIEYGADGIVQQSSAFHTLKTPVGGQYKVLLPDGTKVWLNAESSLKYPLAFTGTIREVELTGEGYFEVAKEKPADITGMELGRRFVVKLKNDARVEVLGTHFNIMAYDNEKYIQTTVLEGSVSVKSISMGSTLSPGDQSSIVEHGFIETKKGVDTNAVIGWKEGQFVFHDAPIESIMRQVERWYDAKIVYEGKNDQLFNATIQRKEPLSKLLHLLETNGYVHFKTENKTIYVLP